MASINEQPGIRLFDASDLNTLASGQGYTTIDNITAAGTTRATATQLQYATMIRIATAAASTGVNLPSAQPGTSIELVNDGANTVAIYALGSDTINGTAGATGITLATTKSASFFCITLGKWHALLSA